jgi:hypothetical protein
VINHRSRVSPQTNTRPRSRLNLARAQRLIALGSALLIISVVSLQGDSRALSAEATTLLAKQMSSTPATNSPSPTPTPAREPSGPNPIRRFFSWSIQPVARLFKKPPPACVLPPFVNVTSSTSVIEICPAGQSSQTCPESREVTLAANVADPDGVELLFTWDVTGGRLTGKGRNVTWDLSGLPEGTYTATVEVNDGNQHTASAATSVTLSRCESCTTLLFSPHERKQRNGGSHHSSENIKRET